MTPAHIKTAPVFRMVDVDKAIAFYVDWLGFSWDWEHRHADGFPLFAGLSLGDMHLHLTEHHGDCAPGGLAMFFIHGIEEYHAELMAKRYAFNRPGLDDMPWGRQVCTIDPFHNKVHFIEPKGAEGDA